MRDVVFAYRTLFASLYTTEGHKSLTEYVGEAYKERTASDSLIVDAIFRVTEKILGSSVGTSVVQSLEKNNYVSTVDHHGPLSHPAFFQPNLLRTILDTEIGLPATIVLSCASVSLDNHTYPRGFYFYDNFGERVRLPLFSLHDRHHSVYGQRPFTHADAELNILKLRQYGEVYDGLLTLLQDEQLYTLETYRAQITYINHCLMREICPEGGNFVSIAIEDVVRELLCTSFLEHDPLTSGILFNAKTRDFFLKETNGIQTSHDFTRRETTVLFWGQRNGVRVPLRIVGEYLIDEIREIQIHLDVRSIQIALHEEKIFPNLALSLILLSSRGMDQGGGFFQVDYLPSLVLHAQKVSSQSGLDYMTWGKTDYLGGDFSFMPKFIGRDVTALDILKNPPCVTDIKYYADTVSVAEAIDRIIPDMYHILDNKLRNEWEHIVMNTTDSL